MTRSSRAFAERRYLLFLYPRRCMADTRRDRCNTSAALWLPASLALMVMFLSAAASAEEHPLSSMTLEEAIAYATSHHPALRALALELEAEEETVTQARSLPDPTVSLQMITMEWRLGLGMSQMFPLAGRRELRGSIARERVLAVGSSVEARTLAVTAGVVVAYSELVFLLRAQELAAENLELVEQMEQVALSRYRTGEAPYADVVRAQVERGRVEDELRSLLDVEGVAVGRLNVAMGRPVNAPLQAPAGLPPVEADYTLEQVLAAVQESNPELEAMRHQASAARDGVELARRNGIPSLMVGAELMYSFEMNRPGAGAMVGINLPIWRERRAAEVREAKARSRAVEAWAADLGLDLEAEVRMALFRFQDAERKIVLYEARLIPQLEHALEATRTAYRAGETTFGELADIARMVLEFRLALERARVDRLQHLAELGIFMGWRVLP